MKVIHAECQLPISLQGLRLKCERFVISKEFEHPPHYSGGGRINDESISIFNERWCGMEPWSGEQKHFKMYALETFMPKFNINFN